MQAISAKHGLGHPYHSGKTNQGLNSRLNMGYKCGSVPTSWAASHGIGTAGYQLSGVLGADNYDGVQPSQDPNKNLLPNKKDAKQGKATLICLLGYKNTIKYSYRIKSKIINDLKKYGLRTNNINETLDYILTRNK